MTETWCDCASCGHDFNLRAMYRHNDRLYCEQCFKQIYDSIVPHVGPMIEKERSAFDVQVGGSHYKKMKIQPAQFCIENGIPWAEGECIVKLVRWREKGGIEDLEKVKHCIDLIIETEKKK